MEGHSVISADVVGAYAADAACEVAGVTGLVEGQLPRHRGIRVVEEDGAVTIEVHVALAWGVSAAAVGAEVQEHVDAYLRRMADIAPAAVDVVVDEIGAPAAA